MVQISLFSSFIVQLCLAALAMAAPIADELVVSATNHGSLWRHATGGSVLGVIILVFDIIVFVEVVKSNRRTSSKLLWCLVVFFFPVVGMVVYWLFSNRAWHNRGDDYEPLA